MTDSHRGSDRAGRRVKRFLSPWQKSEIWLQLVRLEVTITKAAAAQHVDRSTIMRIGRSPRRVRWRRWPRPNPVCRRGARLRVELVKAEVARLSQTGQGDGREADAGRGKRRLG